ncbi:MULTISPECIES: hypothetical protein [Corynebacterium]|uniref:Uncharacterized protein n=1 Tax=Corynebacterium ihumii TaxID=1232427 RepID=A0ABY7UDU0_9CORY|nr:MULTISPECIES: hypothetical protein [Corynebacterium]WCZ33632.1 hypothetical protein CIHUM_00920 [Corynebacterium ihumii]
MIPPIAGLKLAANALLAKLSATASIVAAKGNPAAAEQISDTIRDLREVFDLFVSAIERLVLVLDGKEERPTILQAGGAAAYTHDQVTQTMAAADAARAEAKKYREEAEKYRKNAEAARKNAEAQMQDLNPEAARQRAEAKRRRAFLKMDIELRSYSRAMKLVDPSGRMVSRTETPGDEQLARFSKAVQIATGQVKTAIEQRNAAQREVDTARKTRDILNGWLKDVERAERENGDA